MLQSNYSDSIDIPPSLSAEAEEEFAEMTYAFLDKYLKREEISSIEVVIQWNPKKETGAIVQPKLMTSISCHANKKGTRQKCINTNCYWGPDEGCR